ncbi:MAG: 2Fe-2S iron-sulfur cluster binding domain-containing protein, partial [Dechloromonas sp.]|nr:2Fe-2S iron-sulfur cluster binding domain-containing protein [Dechloromonas sp.]
MSYELTIEPLGQTIEVEDGQTILDAALRAGIYLPHACCHGLCATCKVQVLDGEIDHGEASTFALMDFEREEGKTLACCCRLESDTVIEAEIEEDPDSRNLPVQDYTGEVVRIEALTPTIRGIWLKLDRPMDFQAGQYINLEVPAIDGQSRAFSLANSPQSGDIVELNVRIVPGGQVTTWLHENLEVGEKLKLSGPYGRFFVKKSANLPLIFMAGGSGLSSPKSMIEDLLAEGFDKP